MSGRYRVKHSRDGNILHDFEMHNEMMFAGVEAWLRTIFKQETSITWYMGLADDLPDPMYWGQDEFSRDDTAAAIGVSTDWDEIANYSDTTRREWDPDKFEIVGSGIRVRNETEALFNITGHGLLGGCFLISESTKLGNTGKLLSGSRFPFRIPAVVGDKVEIEYEIFITYS